MKKQFSTTIVGATFLISLTGLISKGVGFLREILYANYFGLQSEFDIYLVSAALPMIISTMLLYLGQNYFIPTYNAISISDQENRKKYFIKSIRFFFVFGIALTIFLFILSTSIVHFFLAGFSAEYQSTALLVFRLFISSFPLLAIVSITIAYQQANYRYKNPAFSQLIVNITLVVILFLFTDKLGVVIIPIAFIVGTVFQVIYLVMNIDIRVTELFKNFIFNVKDFFIPSSLLTIIFIELVGQFYTIADRYFINQIDTGGIAAINYAMNITQLPISIFSLALTTAIFPKLSENFANDSTEELKNKFNLSLLTNLAIFIPVSLILFFYGDIIIRLLFERGKFTSTDSIVTSRLTQIFSLSLIFLSAYSIANKLIYSMNQIKKLFWLTLFGLALKVVLNFILVKEFYQYGLAVSTLLTYVFFFTGGMFIIQKTIKLDTNFIFTKELILLATNGIMSFFISEYCANLLEVNRNLTIVLEIFLFIDIFYLNLFLIQHRTIEIVKAISKSLARER